MGLRVLLHCLSKYVPVQAQAEEQARHLWPKLADAERKVFTDLAQSTPQRMCCHHHACMAACALLSCMLPSGLSSRLCKLTLGWQVTGINNRPNVN